MLAEQPCVVPGLGNVAYCLRLRNTLIIVQFTLYLHVQFVRHNLPLLGIWWALEENMARGLGFLPSVTVVFETNTLSRSHSPNNPPKYILTTQFVD